MILAVLSVLLLITAGCFDREQLARDRDEAVAVQGGVAATLGELEAQEAGYVASGTPVPEPIAAGIEAARATHERLGEWIVRADAVLASVPDDANAYEVGGAVLTGTATAAPTPATPWLLLGGSVLTGIGLAVRGSRLAGDFRRVVGTIQKEADDNGGTVDFSDKETRVSLKAGMGTQARDRVNKLKGGSA